MSIKLPKITIVTIVYNGEKYIRETILSLINQGYENLEYIIIDGGSTDNTLNIIDEFKSKINVIISEKDSGISDAFNKGLSHATGDLIGFLNADDFYEPFALNKLSNFYLENKLKGENIPFVIHGKTYSLENDIKKIKNDTSLGWWLSAPFSHCSSFISNDYYTTYGGFNLSYKIAMDVDFFLKSYNEIQYYRINCFIATQRTGGVSDINRIKGYKEYYQTVKSRVGYFKAIIGFSIKYLIYLKNKYAKIT
tara:strand:- start:2215 stop:2967 length:753 start_codon:yes stop_codon:yes gene_type:complete